MKIIKSHIIFTAIILAGIFNSCKFDTAKRGNLTNSLDEKITNESQNSSKGNINSDLEDSSRLVGGIKLEPKRGGGFEAYNINGYNYIENYPLIINKQKVQGSKVEQILFYKNDSTLKEVIDIKKINPYLQQYNNVKYEYPTFEWYEMANDSLVHLYKNGRLEPNEYLTNRYRARTLRNGYSFVSYDLIPTINYKLLDWTCLTLIINVRGDIIDTINFTEITLPVSISNNGQLLVVRKGLQLDYPLTNYPQGEFAIVDLIKRKEIFSILTPDGHEAVNASIGPQGRFVDLGYNFIGKSKTNKIFVKIVDLNERKLYSAKLNLDEYMNFFQNNRFYATVDLLGRFNFDITKF